MRVSIITATYNSEKGISNCMQSVLNQTYPNIEYIIIDGKSKDSTLKLVTEYQEKYPNIKMVSEPDSGIYEALNKGVSLATGDIVGFVHSDDFLASNEVIQHITTVFKNTNSHGVYGDLQYVDQHDTNKIIRYWKSCNFTPKLLKKGWMPAHPTLFLKQDVYKKHGTFDLNYKIAADYDFILRVFKDQSLKFTYLPKVITKMRIGGASNRSLKNIIQKTKEDYKAMHKNNLGGWPTIVLKNVSKISQFYKK